MRSAAARGSTAPLVLTAPMLITRKTKVPLHWVFYAQLPFTLAIWAGGYSSGMLVLAMKKFIDNPAAITFLLSLDVVFTAGLGPFFNWLSDRIWTRFGRRRPLIVMSSLSGFVILPLMPFAPDIWTLLILKWLFTICGSMGTPNQALTMEVVPTPQRGRGAGFFNMQIQIINLVTWGVVIGRWDDVYFLGPLRGVLWLSGEHLMFMSGGLLLAAVGFFTFFGFKEIRPPVRRRLRDDRRPGEGVFRLFCRSFFGDILSRELLPLYMLSTVGIMFGVGLGVLGPLLYTEQWGYSLQQMGTNVAIGASINIVIAIFAGYFADATSKMKVYVIALLAGLIMKFIWVGYVFLKPGHRPELWEIVLFGEISAIFGMIAGVVSFPLILEYVERNRLGTAGAGSGLYNTLVNNGFTILVGAWIVWWSVLFLPQAGERVEVVLAEEYNLPALRTLLREADPALTGLDLAPLHPPGTDGPSSRHWEIRRASRDSAQLQARVKDLQNKAAKWSASLESPLASPARRDSLRQRIEEVRTEIASLEAVLNSGAGDFRRQVEQAVSAHLVPAGAQFLGLRMEEGVFDLALSTVEPVTEVHAANLARVLESFEFALLPPPQPEEDPDPDLRVEPLGPSVDLSLPGAHGFRLSGRVDPGFLALNRCFAEADLDYPASRELAAILIGLFRNALGPDPGAAVIRKARYESDPEGARMVLTLRHGPSEAALGLDAFATILAEVPEIRRAQAQGSWMDGTLRIDLVHPLPGESPATLAARAASFPLADPDAARYLDDLYERAVAAAAASPVFLTVDRPVVRSGYADRKYDYFFSVYFLMILTDFFGLGVIWLVIRLERRGLIQRRGVLEDANR